MFGTRPIIMTICQNNRIIMYTTNVVNLILSTTKSMEWIQIHCCVIDESGRVVFDYLYVVIFYVFFDRLSQTDLLIFSTDCCRYSIDIITCTCRCPEYSVCLSAHTQTDTCTSVPYELCSPWGLVTNSMPSAHCLKKQVPSQFLPP